MLTAETLNAIGYLESEQCCANLANFYVRGLEGADAAFAHKRLQGAKVPIPVIAMATIGDALIGSASLDGLALADLGMSAGDSGDIIDPERIGDSIRIILTRAIADSAVGNENTGEIISAAKCAVLANGKEYVCVSAEAAKRLLRSEGAVVYIAIAMGSKAIAYSFDTFETENRTLVSSFVNIRVYSEMDRWR